MKLVSLILISSGLILTTGCGSNKKKIAPPAQGNAKTTLPTKVDAYIVNTETFGETIEVPGTVVSNEVTEIHPEVSGRIVYLNLAEGKYVPKGTLLAKLYDGDLLAQLQKLEVQLKLAEKTEERQSQLLKIQGISQADYDISQLNVSNLKADIGIIKTSIAKTEVRAPFGGKLGLKNISQGAFVSPSSIIGVINQTNQLKLDFSIPEKYTGQIKNGQLIQFTFEGSDEIMHAKVIATEANVTETTRSLMARALVTSKNSSLLPGAFAKVQMSFAPNPNAILIPSQAIIPQARGKKVILMKDGKASFADVTTGVRDSSRVQIIEGLHAGDTVIVTGLLSVRPESALSIGKIVNAKQKTEN